MEKQYSKAGQAYTAIGAALGWLAVFGQLYLIILNRTTSVPDTLIRFISYYTILTNILVALCFTFLLIGSRSRWKAFFSRPTVLTAITVNIVVVGAVYNTILRFIWEPQGMQMIVDELLHSVMPLVFLFYWLIFVPKSGLQWKNIFPWLLYPLVYFIYILIRGSLTAQYPYPFVDVTQIGYSAVLVNSGIITLVFLLLSLGFISLAKLMSRSR